MIPVFKAGDHGDPSNYRPISILVVISKIAERAVFDQLYNYLNDNGLININQSGFRPIHSTSSALINITEDWYDEIDKGNLIGLCLLDLKKAFDTVNHEIFLDKLKLYGISKYCIQWFRSYLTGRSQCTTVDGILSDTCEITCGMPQGSIDGPLAFLIYINDLPNYVTHCKVNMYADDTVIYYASNSTNDIVNCINEDLNVISNWLQSNKLSLNADKTEFMLIGSRQRLQSVKDDIHNVTVTINGTNIKRVNECKHLGVIIDDILSWNQQIDQVRKKSLKGMFMLKKCKCNFISQDILNMVYNAIVLPHLEYCNVVWGNCGISIANRLQIIQNRAARIICGAPWDTSSTFVLDQLNWKPLSNRHQYNVSIWIYKILNNLAPPYLSAISAYSNNKYNFRQSKNNVFIPQPKTDFKKRSLSYRGAIIWNNLDDKVTNSSNLYTFKNMLKDVVF